MVKIGPSGLGAVGNVGAGSNDFGNHGESAQKSRNAVAQSNGEQVAVGIGLTAVRIQAVDRLHGQKRLKASD